ncbi:MAG: hypothetical protein R2828_35990 [Saprospiraceae bacterium]
MSILLLLSGCSWMSNSNEYEAYWYETYYKLTLNKNLTFKYIYEGHRGNSEFKGTYKIHNDTIILNESSHELKELKFLRHQSGCLVELETRFSYCKRTTEEWGSERIAINYPQLKESNKKEKEEVIKLINIALTNPALEKYFIPTNNPLIIQEYYEINANNNVRLIYKGKEAQILTKEQIEENGISRYLIIDEVTIGLKSVMIDFQVMPEGYIGVLDFFNKENEEWKLLKRTL